MFRDDVIYQIQKDYGWTKEKATKYYNQIDEDMKKEYFAEFHSQAVKSFYED